MTSSLSDFDFDPSFDALTNWGINYSGRAVQFLVEVCRLENVIPGNVNLMIPSVEKQYVSTSLKHPHLPLVRTLSQGTPGASKPFEHSHLPGTFLSQLRPVVERIPLVHLFEHPHLPWLTSLVHQNLILILLVILIVSFEHPQLPFLIFLDPQWLIIVIFQPSQSLNEIISADYRNVGLQGFHRNTF